MGKLYTQRHPETPTGLWMLASPDGEAVNDGPDEAQQQVPVVKGSICRVVVPDRPRAVNQKADVRLHSTLCAKGGANRDS